MKLHFFILSILIIDCLTICAQSNKINIKRSADFFEQHRSKSSFQEITLSEYSIAEVERYLLHNIQTLQVGNMTIKLVNEINSMGGIHLTFSQYYKGMPVFDGQVKVNLDLDGNIRSLFDNTYKFTIIPSSDFPNQQDIFGKISKNITHIDYYSTMKTYFPSGAIWEPCVKITISESSELSYELLVNTRDSVIYKHNVSLNLKQQNAIQDSVISCLVFLPDPLTTAGVTYGAPYIDNNDNDVAELNSERQLKNTITTYSAGVFTLSNSFIQITEHSSPNIPPVSSSSPFFYYTRSESGFEDINVFYHITSFQQYIQSLGFNNLVNYQIHADTHGFNDQDNSNFNPSYNPPRLTFGEGGVDDAEDADVIIHEYGHAISHSAAPGTNSGFERQSLDEANGDYLAASYSRYLNPYKWENVFSWDGHNEFWPGRSVVSSKHYPEDIVGNIYEDAEIWSSTLMQIWTDLGREETDKILLESMYSYAKNISIADAAWLLVQSDSILNNGINYNTICQHLLDRGLVTTCNQTDCKPIADFAFTTNGKLVSFYDSSKYALSFRWDFGDGFTSTMMHPVHTYLETGNYSVQLNVFNQCGSDSIIKDVEIQKAEENIQLINSQDFTYFNEDAVIDFGVTTSAVISIYNIKGQIVDIVQSHEMKSYLIKNISFNTGVYFIKVVTDNNSVLFKLVRL